MAGQWYMGFYVGCTGSRVGHVVCLKARCLVHGTREAVGVLQRAYIWQAKAGTVDPGMAEMIDRQSWCAASGPMPRGGQVSSVANAKWLANEASS